MKFTVIRFKPDFFIAVYSSYIHPYLFLSLVYPPLFLYASLSIQIDTYLFVKSKFTAISFKRVFFISVYSSYIHLYLFLSLVYPPLFLPISSSIQIDANLFVNSNHGYIFQTRFLYLYLFFLYPTIFVSISCLSTSISSYLFVNPNSWLYLSNAFSLSPSILRISTYICFYLLSIHLYIFIPLCQSKLMPISLSIQIHGYIFQTRFLYLCLFFVYPAIFISMSCLSISISLYLFVNPNSQLYFSNLFSLSLSNLYISTYTCFYLLSIHFSFFVPLSQSKFMPISLSTEIHGYIFQCSSLCINISLIYLPLSLSISCISLCQSSFPLISFNHRNAYFEALDNLYYTQVVEMFEERW